MDKAKFFRIITSQLEQIIVIGIFITLTLLYYRDIFHNWFFYDDPAAIVWSMEPLRNIFFSVNYSPSFYTPLVALSFKPDVLLWGINPLPYHIHNAILLACVSFAAYHIIRLYGDKMSALLPAVIILFSPPALVCLVWLVLRQYLYPMLLSLIIVYVFLKYQPLPRRNPFLVALLLILAELSFMGKEQFMTLPIVLLLIADGDIKKKIARTYPFFILFVCHFYLRIHILESFGGYSGAHYDPWDYMKTVFQSILRTAGILSGTPWFMIIIAGPLLLFKREKTLFAFMLWLSSLLVTFLALNVYPQADFFRYWLIPVVLFSLFIGLSASIVKNAILRKAYLLVITATCLFHSLTINKELKAFFTHESFVAKRVTEILLDPEYRTSAFLHPDDVYLLNSPYLEHMLRAFRQLEGVTEFNAIVPLEFFAIFPNIRNYFYNVYMIENGQPLCISTVLEEKIAQLKGTTVSSKKLDVRLNKTANKTELILFCESGKQLLAFKKLPFGNAVTKQILPYFDRITLNPYIQLMRSKAVDIVPISQLAFGRDGLSILSHRADTIETFFIFSCIDETGHRTALSDILLFVR